MRHLLEAAIVLMVLSGGGSAGVAQTSTAGQTATSPEQKAGLNAPDATVQRTDKQLALQAQTDRLVAMATELRDQVDKTNKNILSLKVVQKAEEIEQFAKRLKEQAKK